MTRVLLLGGLATCFALVGCQQQGQSTLTPTTDQDKQSYSVGATAGASIKQNTDQITSVVPDFDINLFLQGVEDALKGEEQLPQEEIRQIASQFHQDFFTKQREQQQAQAAENIERGKSFLEENAKKEGVVQTESGLQYRVLAEGTGGQPAVTDTVKVHYKGTLLDGTEFDSSYKRGNPATFPLNGVIKGWTEGLQTMKVGGKSEFYIPADLAYGSSPRPSIPGNSTLVFEVELLDIVKAEAEAAAN